MDLSVNGRRHALDVDPSRTLLDVLRDELELTGTKYGCGEGQCGACTVLVDGQPLRACVTRVGGLGNADVRTIEGLATEDGLHPLQQAFLDEGAMQCGFCTAGMVVSACGLLEQDGDPDERAIVEHMRGNVCRCGTYPRIVRAIRRAAAAIKGGAK